VNPIAHHRPLPDEEHATAQQLSQCPRRLIRNPDRRQELDPREFSQLPRVDRIRLRPRLPDQLHLVGMRHEHREASRRELSLEPVPIECRFHRDEDRLRESTEPPA
jgi:hypothetical protein